MTACSAPGCAGSPTRAGSCDRLARLEAEVDELQQLNLRLAELTDVVQELLLPLARQDPERAVELLERFREELGT